jgi:hypothetical protein
VTRQCCATLSQPLKTVLLNCSRKLFTFLPDLSVIVMKYLTLGESRNMIRFLKFVGLLEAEDSETLDCVIEHISLDQLRLDF